MFTKFKLPFFLFFALIFSMGMSKKGAPSEYESGWLTIAPGEILVIAHPLEITPRLIAVNTKLTYGPEDIESVRPHTELPNHPLFISDMTPQSVIIQNQGEDAYTLKIYVR